VGIFFADRFLSIEVPSNHNATEEKDKGNPKLFTSQPLVALVVLLESLAPLLVNARSTVVTGVGSVDALVVLLGPLLDGLDSLGKGGWRRFGADRLLRCGRAGAGLSWAGCQLSLSWVANTVVCLQCGVDGAVVLLVFLSNDPEAVLDGLGGEDGGFFPR